MKPSILILHGYAKLTQSTIWLLRHSYKAATRKLNNQDDNLLPLNFIAIGQSLNAAQPTGRSLGQVLIVTLQLSRRETTKKQALDKIADDGLNDGQAFTGFFLMTCHHV